MKVVLRSHFIRTVVGVRATVHRDLTQTEAYLKTLEDNARVDPVAQTVLDAAIAKHTLLMEQLHSTIKRIGKMSDWAVGGAMLLRIPLLLGVRPRVGSPMQYLSVLDETILFDKLTLLLPVLKFAIHYHYYY
ncbi:hypothetical protein NDU88_001523 [Pleurodeles waltl]|uniref:Uncharacterized protein n=1 Tax=Pleurodeles waltl TaxID=8319 RepID=A0AAV7WMX5_PLEWA|nr:hypothetical protein NDU88_001523 [Pleurodeles waltl]